MGYWLSCNGVALLVMGPVAYGLSGIQNPSFATWKVLFHVLGAPTIVTGLLYL